MKNTSYHGLFSRAGQGTGPGACCFWRPGGTVRTLPAWEKTRPSREIGEVVVGDISLCHNPHDCVIFSYVKWIVYI